MMSQNALRLRNLFHFCNDSHLWLQEFAANRQRNTLLAMESSASKTEAAPNRRRDFGRTCGHIDTCIYIYDEGLVSSIGAGLFQCCQLAGEHGFTHVVACTCMQSFAQQLRRSL